MDSLPLVVKGVISSFLEDTGINLAVAYRNTDILFTTKKGKVLQVINKREDFSSYGRPYLIHMSLSSNKKHLITLIIPEERDEYQFNIWTLSSGYWYLTNILTKTKIFSQTLLPRPSYYVNQAFISNDAKIIIFSIGSTINVYNRISETLIELCSLHNILKNFVVIQNDVDNSFVLAFNSFFENAIYMLVVGIDDLQIRSTQIFNDEERNDDGDYTTMTLVDTIALSGDLQTLVTLSRFKKIIGLWLVSSGSFIRLPEPETLWELPPLYFSKPYPNVAITSKSEIVVCAICSNIYIWEKKGLSWIFSFCIYKAHKGYGITSIMISDDGETLVSTSIETGITIWKVNDKREWFRVHNIASADYMTSPRATAIIPYKINPLNLLSKSFLK